MDTKRFDIAACAIGRRGVLKGIIAFGAAYLAIPVGRMRAGVEVEPCAERGSGERCRNGGQCCSGRCRKKKGKRKGRCRCSPLRAPCATDSDCCGNDPLESGHPVCDILVIGPTARGCCMPDHAPCQTSADCCRPFACDLGGFCRSE